MNKKLFEVDPLVHHFCAPLFVMYRNIVVVTKLMSKHQSINGGKECPLNKSIPDAFVVKCVLSSSSKYFSCFVKEP